MNCNFLNEKTGMCRGKEDRFCVYRIIIFAFFIVSLFTFISCESEGDLKNDESVNNEEIVNHFFDNALTSEEEQQIEEAFNTDSTESNTEDNDSGEEMNAELAPQIKQMLFNERNKLDDFSDYDKHKEKVVKYLNNFDVGIVNSFTRENGVYISFDLIPGYKLKEWKVIETYDGVPYRDNVYTDGDGHVYHDRSYDRDVGIVESVIVKEGSFEEIKNYEVRDLYNWTGSIVYYVGNDVKLEIEVNSGRGTYMTYKLNGRIIFSANWDDLSQEEREKKLNEIDEKVGIVSSASRSGDHLEKLFAVCDMYGGWKDDSEIKMYHCESFETGSNSSVKIEEAVSQTSSSKKCVCTVTVKNDNHELVIKAMRGFDYWEHWEGDFRDGKLLLDTENWKNWTILKFKYDGVDYNLDNVTNEEFWN